MKQINIIFSGALILLTLMAWSSSASALVFKYNEVTGRVEITIGGPLTGGTQTIPLLNGETVLSDMTSLAGQFSVAVDEALSTISGCIKDSDGKPVIGALVLGIKPDSPQPLTFAVTAGQSGFGFYGFPPFNWPVPSPPQPAGCYTMVIPPGLLDFGFTAMFEGLENVGAKKLGPSEAKTGSVTAISVTAFIPGYALDPGIRHIIISPTGVVSLSSADGVDRKGRARTERPEAR
jgi:hypothetical protein